MNKISLTEEKETLLVPLLGKAKDCEKENPILNDHKAAEIVSQIDYDFTSLKAPDKTSIMLSIRAKLIDAFVREFFSEEKDGVALHLGSGLDSRYFRIGNDSIDWYDVDFAEVIEIRRHFYEETDNYHMLSSSVTELEWIEKIPTNKNKYIVIAEGLFMYLKEEDIKQLLNRLKNRVGNYTLIFDAYSTLAAKNVKSHPSLKKTGAHVFWGLDNPAELTKWDDEIEFIEEKYLTSNKEVDKLNLGMKTIFKIANLLPLARRSHRLLVYRVG